MTVASAEVRGAGTRARALGVLLIIWLMIGAVGGLVRFVTAPPLSSSLAWLNAPARPQPPPLQSTEPANDGYTYTPAAPAVSPEDRALGLTRLERLSSDVTNGRPQADVRTFPAYSAVGYYVEFENADNDSIRIELLDHGEVIGSCTHAGVNGAGSRNCQFPSMAPGHYEIRVMFSGYRTAMLGFDVANVATQNYSDADASGPVVITDPRWIQRPRGSDLARFYPDRAERAGRTGQVVLDCVVQADGRVNCNVASEEPTGWGFGAASLRVARLFRMSPQLEDGKPSEGGRVSVPITWQLND